jgi:hypothetical protein
MLTAIRPLAPRASLVVPAVAVTWIGTAAAAFKLRSSRRILSPLVVPAAAFLAAKILATPIAVAIGPPLIFLAGCTAHVLISVQSKREFSKSTERKAGGPEQPEYDGPNRSSLRSLPKSAAITIAIATFSVLLAQRAPWANDRDPLDPRTIKEPDPLTLQAQNPLAAISAMLRNGSIPQFVVDTDRVPQQWRTLILDQFDGATWHATGKFRSVSGRLPIEGKLGSQLVRVREHFTILGLGSLWLPITPTAVAVDGSQLLFDPSSGTLATTARPSPSFEYSVQSAVAGVDVGNDVPGTATPREIELRDRELTALPAQVRPDSTIRKKAEAFVGATSGDEAKADAILEGFKNEHFQLTATAAPGHSVKRVENFLETHIGTYEQFATAFALMARASNLKARVAMGFHPPASAKVGRPAKGLVINSDRIYAWAEVFVFGRGWVMFDPAQTASNHGAAQPTPSPQPRPTIKATAKPPPTPPPPGSQSPNSLAKNPRRLALFLSLAFIASTIVFAIALLCQRASIRRRRRRSTSLTRRVLGAWEELLERLAVTGVQGIRSMTAIEVTVATGERLGNVAQDHARGIGRLVNACVFGRHQPDEREADEAWQSAQQVRRRADTDLGTLAQAFRRIRLSLGLVRVR